MLLWITSSSYQNIFRSWSFSTRKSSMSFTVRDLKIIARSWIIDSRSRSVSAAFAHKTLPEAPSQGPVTPLSPSTVKSDVTGIWSFLFQPGVNSHPTPGLATTQFSRYCVSFVAWTLNTLVVRDLGLVRRANIRIQRNPAPHSEVWVWWKLILRPRRGGSSFCFCLFFVILCR